MRKKIWDSILDRTDFIVIVFFSFTIFSILKFVIYIGLIPYDEGVITHIVASILGILVAVIVELIKSLKREKVHLILQIVILLISVAIIYRISTGFIFRFEINLVFYIVFNLIFSCYWEELNVSEKLRLCIGKLIDKIRLNPYFIGILILAIIIIELFFLLYKI
ncbi:hypothetical protein QV06_00565 [Gallibacterium genomosp. 3]|uniref:Uncharacterized protein n=1 Tax=Gallibacterium genomosp. 3 TaxID=505345 RepID=A0A1A7PV61_9PAST|nr:hypothetical protein [Gallibacterium genomosp. 3]OBX05929.1 hypothetical protein QV06_00565 [Gallibacterium genomosp. 3]